MRHFLEPLRYAARSNGRRRPPQGVQAVFT
jgi:hypothetical protein